MEIVDLAGEAESRGLTSLSFPEHTHIPVGSHDGPGGEIPHRYRRTLDPFVLCAFVAASSQLAVGTAISLVAQHDAIALAKVVATLDHLSKGRFTLGVGFGYNRQEAEDHGSSAKRRAVVVEETVRLMRAIWTKDEAVIRGSVPAGLSVVVVAKARAARRTAGAARRRGERKELRANRRLGRWVDTHGPRREF